MILITGAAGKTGQAVIRALQARREAVRALAFRPQQAAPLLALGVHDVVTGDMGDAQVYRQAASGVRALYHICPNMSPHEVDMGRTAIAAAREAGVDRFVYHSVLHPQTEAMPHHWQKLRVEELLFEAGLDFTILQPAAYMQNILGGWDAISGQGFYRVPYPPETRLNMVDLADVAEVASRVLCEPGHAGATYELAGPENLTQIEVATTLGRYLGRPVRAAEVPLAAWSAQAEAAGLGRHQIDTLVKMFRYYARHGFPGNAGVLRWLLGRPPTDFAAFARRVIGDRGPG